ncbi:MAG: hypothetical protein OSB69_03610 [Alphaproteobacteria bacterium]|nr:hypothetical protein [Alphaproteobacteria bacterium]
MTKSPADLIRVPPGKRVTIDADLLARLINTPRAVARDAHAPH